MCVVFFVNEATRWAYLHNKHGMLFYSFRFFALENQLNTYGYMGTTSQVVTYKERKFFR